jgi:hypothetical protein
MKLVRFWSFEQRLVDDVLGWCAYEALRPQQPNNTPTSLGATRQYLGPVVNLTTSGDTMSYASDGKYIYLVYEPKLSLTYNNTILEELTLTGAIVKALSIPRVVGINAARNG